MNYPQFPFKIWYQAIGIGSFTIAFLAAIVGNFIAWPLWLAIVIIVTITISGLMSIPYYLYEEEDTDERDADDRS